MYVGVNLQPNRGKAESLSSPKPWLERDRQYESVT